MQMLRKEISIFYALQTMWSESSIEIASSAQPGCSYTGLTEERELSESEQGEFCLTAK